MKNLLSIKFFALLLTLFIIHSMDAQTNVEINGGDKLYGDQANSLVYIVGNVVIKHDGITIMCDSAVRNTQKGIIEGFGHVYIFQPDTFTLTGGDYLKYDEATKNAFVTGKQVVLSDKNMTLTTTSLNYNVKDQFGYYTNTANIINGSNHLTSQRGYYYRRGNYFNFKKNVVLTSPEYTMNSDTLVYYANNKTAFFNGPTKIVSGENTITCNYGWYNTASQKAQFSKGATIYSGTNTISADSLLYDKKTEIGRAYGNLKLYDSTENIEVYGQRGLYKQKTKETIISQFPVAIQRTEDDTLYVMADTFYFINDSLNRKLLAYPHTEISQSEFQGKCDSLVYRFNDSTISLYHNPILWNDKNQITGDTMHILMKNKKISLMRVIGNAFLASQINLENYNQIAGKLMTNSFDDNKLKSVLVENNAESIYYLRNNETDSAEYTGVNKVKCEKMKIQLDSNKVQGIKFYGAPEGKMYPIKDFPQTEKLLSGLNWQIENKPILSKFVDRTKRKEVVQIIKEISPKKEKKVKTKPKKK